MRHLGPGFALALTLASAWAPSLLPTPAAAQPAGEDSATVVLNRSPRHGEFVDVKRPSGGTPIRTWVSYPERKDKAGVVIVIQEIFGLTDWLRAVADQLAADGFIAVVPDLISGLGPNGGGTESVASRDSVVALTRGLTPEETKARLDAVYFYAAATPAGNGKIATMGFCWGGARSFAYAATQTKLKAAVVYYGSSPDSTLIGSVRAPVQGHYGSDDARVNATIDPAKAALGKLGRSYEPFIYEGAGHGFLRAQSGREGANLKASKAAWPKTIAFLKKHIS
ncbi:MAG: dienelactone hydrolase family protein [Candidatus Eiseniibacteriota bacterium]